MPSGRAQIVTCYKRATYCYALPFALGLFGVIVPFFFALALLSLLPFGLAGLFLTKRGWKLAVRSGDQEKKDVGYANFVLGGIILLLGFLGLGLAYVVTG
ncbi:hypothetical protein [Hymenobacter sp. B81]|uniref:hypothetical protein n=1 Tax=Hymenobacter sp. B81 TaxID=3344878 RepID=UPI0037DD4F4A